ncbi:hypothetical protein FJT64_017496 [Amphibalanus amphitrite]|uniref:Uncharacterized protein n=1 Tax=Amphibalanus amphitrite TaxID=1232801 RepID=A0A6A4WW67_AMPAM|nr:hypothetical protein FJT64_017496 [Amphibalanus amphitrite]KAF0311737.1 hypothetical protein FJT64_017496 [Amphibalanus amphitrite]
MSFLRTFLRRPLSLEEDLELEEELWEVLLEVGDLAEVWAEELEVSEEEELRPGELWEEREAALSRRLSRSPLPSRPVSSGTTSPRPLWCLLRRRSETASDTSPFSNLSSNPFSNLYSKWFSNRFSFRAHYRSSHSRCSFSHHYSTFTISRPYSRLYINLSSSISRRPDHRSSGTTSPRSWRRGSPCLRPLLNPTLPPPPARSGLWNPFEWSTPAPGATRDPRGATASSAAWNRASAAALQRGNST